jgi:exo-beta-1,3-glucanase (GH17 family)
VSHARFHILTREHHASSTTLIKLAISSTSSSSTSIKGACADRASVSGTKGFELLQYERRSAYLLHSTSEVVIRLDEARHVCVVLAFDMRIHPLEKLMHASTCKWARVNNES